MSKHFNLSQQKNKLPVKVASETEIISQVLPAFDRLVGANVKT